MATPVEITIKRVSAIADAPHAVVPEESLKRFFKIWDIDLTFHDGGNIPFDPSIGTADWQDFLTIHAPPAGQTSTPAILLISTLFNSDIYATIFNDSAPPDGIDYDLINGFLLNPGRRGVIAVYVNSFSFFSGNANQRFEIFAHEIGHLLNLAHADDGAPYPTIMHQFGTRAAVTDRQAVWQEAETISSPQVQSRMNDFFNAEGHVSKGLPLSQSDSLFLLNHRPITEILPWGSQFKAGYSIDTDATES